MQFSSQFLIKNHKIQVQVQALWPIVSFFIAWFGQLNSPWDFSTYYLGTLGCPFNTLRLKANQDGYCQIELIHFRLNMLMLQNKGS